jgi:lipopolysaccharide biosynthesis glycosyltransferase
MLAVTIGVGEKWRGLAELAAECVRLRTGLEARVIGEEAMARYGFSQPHWLKFRLFEEFPEVETILYFDADTIFLAEWDPRVLAGRSEFICVRDRADDENIRREARDIDLPADMYFNSGFFIANRTHHAALLRKAEHDVAQYETIFRDQTHLNRARMVLGIPALFLPKQWNFLGFDRHADDASLVVGHFYHLDHRSMEEAAEYFRGWIGARGGRRRTRGPSATCRDRGET